MDETVSKPEETSRDSGAPDIVIVPIKIPGQADPEGGIGRESGIIRAILSGNPDSSSSSSYVSSPDDSSDDSGDDSDNDLTRSRLSFHSVSDDADATARDIAEATGVSGDEAITRAAKCGAFWKSLGAESVIYMASYGGCLLANGLIIRFAGLNPLLSTLGFGSYAGLSYHNARILFTSLIKPPQDDLPEDSRQTFRTINKYAFLPISWIVATGVSGTILGVIGDESFGTQQAVAVPSSLLIGPLMSGLSVTGRECLGGSIIVEPADTRQRTVASAFRTAYGTDPNPLDDDRSYRYGTLRDVFLRLLSINLGTIAGFATGATSLATYCIGGREDFLNATMSGDQTDVSALLNEHCLGGQATYAFRELGIALSYGLGVLVVEPLLTSLLNPIYDYFYPRGQASDSADDTGPRIEDVTEDQ